MFRAHTAVVVSLALALSAAATSSAPIPPPRKFRQDHYAYAEIEQLLREHASRPKVHPKLAEAGVTAHDVVGKKQFLAIPPAVRPSKRALILLDHWPRATYAGLIAWLRMSCSKLVATPTRLAAAKTIWSAQSYETIPIA
jgi:hypothetical protein